MKVRIITFGVAIAVGLFGGFLIRALSQRQLLGERGHGATNSGASGAVSEDAGAEVSVAPRSRGEAQEKADLMKSVGVSRWLHWVASLEHASLDDMERLVEFTRGDAPAQKMLIARWIELDPQHLFEVVAAADENSPAGRLEWSMLDELAKNNLEVLVEALRRSDSPRVKSMRRSVIGRVIEKDAELGLALFHEWGVEGYRPHMTAVEKWAGEDPQHAAEFVLAHRSGIVTEFAAQMIGKKWAEADPEAALDFAELTPGRYGYVIAEEALSTWAKRDLLAAADWLGKADEGTHARMAAAFVGAWAETDPEAALGWSQENLTGQALANAVEGTVRGLVENDHGAAARMVSDLEPSKAKSAGAVVVARKWLPEWGVEAPMPAAAIGWMSELDESSLVRVLDSISWQWVRNDRDGLAEFLTRPESAAATQATLATAARGLVRHDPEGAIAWVQQLPEAGVTPAARSVFINWHRTQPEAAMAWLEAVPESAGEKDALARAAARAVLGGEPSDDPFTD